MEVNNMYFYVYDVGNLPLHAPFLENDYSEIDIELLMDADPELISYGFEFLASNEDDENYEDMKSLHLGKIDYLVIGSGGGSAECYVLVNSPEMYKSFVEYMLTNPVLDYTIPADTAYITDNTRNAATWVLVKGKPHILVEARKGKLLTKDAVIHNPYNAVEELTSLCELDPYEVREFMEEHYPHSVSSPDKFLEDHPEPLYKHYHSADFTWIGSKGRMLRLQPSMEDRIHPVEGNIFYDEKLCAVADAPTVYDFKIPFMCGYCEVYTMDCDTVLSAMSHNDKDYYEPDADDVGEVHIQLRDGNHRTIGALASGNDTYVFISDNQYQDYKAWIAKGKPHHALYKWLDDNLI
jgi:hypothetical protein